MSIKTTLNRIFLIQCCLEPFGQHCIGFSAMQCCPKSIKITLHRTFSYTKLSVASAETILHTFAYNTFFMQFCLEPLGQYCIGFSPVQCYSKSIKTTLNRIISYAMLSRATQTTLHKILTCAMLSQEY